MKKTHKGHRPELRRAAREFSALVPKGREVTLEMIRDGVNALVPVPAHDAEIISLIGYLVDGGELRSRLDKDAEKTFYKFA
jgi:hypothetical protein